MNRLENKLLRYDLQIIASWIEPGSRVIGLGCGEGELLAYLKRYKGVKETGIEIDETKVEKCIEKGISVIQGDLNEEINDYPDECFDYVILSQTLQQVFDPVRVIRSMLRIGRYGIVSFPNFGHLEIRLQLLFKGCAPVTPQLPYQWYNTPNIRILSLKDFRNFAKVAGVTINREIAINTDQQDRYGRIIKFCPNLFATYGIYLITKNPEAMPWVMGT